MNGMVSRRIRKSVFGEYSLKHKEYGVFSGAKVALKKLIWPGEKATLTKAGQILCLGLRSKYKATKKGYKAMKRRGLKHPMMVLIKNKGGGQDGTRNSSKI